jgi:uncharacterized surface protein with fasciclin (FAS1) repeats
MTTDSKTQTTRFRKPLRGALLAGALFLAACGSDGTEIASDPAEPATTTEAPSTTTEAAMDDAMEDAMLGAFGPACDAVPADGEGSFAGMADDTAATAASNNPLLSTLVTAVVEADLVDTLNSDGPFTIFAPTNDAFAAIPEDILGAVLADQDLLTAVLTYHVVGGDSLNAEALGSTGAAASVEGGELTFGSDGTSVDDATVICSDVPVANGTVHIIDSVLLPQVALDAIATLTAADAEETAMADMLGATGPACDAVPTEGEGSFAGMADDTAATAASNNPLLSTLVTAVVQAELVDTLNSDGPFTIFAPVNDAFAALPADQLEAVLADQDLLTSILTYHVVAALRSRPTISSWPAPSRPSAAVSSPSPLPAT